MSTKGRSPSIDRRRRDATWSVPKVVFGRLIFQGHNFPLSTGQDMGKKENIDGEGVL